MIIWIIGLSGSGKTTLGKEILNQLGDSKKNWMLMDGDIFREILGGKIGHDILSRKKVGEGLVNLSLEFDRQDKNLIVCVLSLFPEHQAFNRKNISNYKEIFIDVSIENLKKRDNKFVYSKNKNIVGLDIPFKKPKYADLVIDNNKNLKSFIKTAKRAVKKFKLEEIAYEYTKKDLFIFKEKYEYSKFQGKEFIKNYLDSRDNFLRFLDAKLKSINLLYPTKEHEHFLFRHSKPINNYFLKKELFIPSHIKDSENTKVMLLYWLKLLRKDKLPKNLIQKILTLLKRFEVSKRLYEGYTKDFKKLGNITETLDVYILFGLVLVKTLYRSSSLNRNIKLQVILFNTILKLCDLISSSKEKLTTPGEISLCNELILEEKNIFRLMEKSFD